MKGFLLGIFVGGSVTLLAVWLWPYDPTYDRCVVAQAGNVEFCKAAIHLMKK